MPHITYVEEFTKELKEIPHSMKYSIDPRSNPALENEPMNFAANKPHSGINC
jgi:hypothetical protein